MMYVYDLIDGVAMNDLSILMSNRGLISYVDGNMLYVCDQEYNNIFCGKIDSMSIFDVNNILSTSLIDSKYLYYFIDIARNNSSLDVSGKTKKKSL